MVGNVMEWTADGWHPDYTGAPVDGSAWAGPLATARGGAFRGSAWTATQRGAYFEPLYVSTLFGFRCVR
jgi:formylglycine-generating enzyme required for sulfatase activity